MSELRITSTNVFSSAMLNSCDTMSKLLTDVPLAQFDPNRPLASSDERIPRHLDTAPPLGFLLDRDG